MPRGTHPNSLANLKAPWKPGYAPNPGGRPKRSLYLSEALRMLSDRTESELRAIADDEGAVVALRAAAKQYLAALNDSNTQHAGKALDRVADRLEGKPTQMQKIALDNEPIKRFVVEAPEPPSLRA